MTPTERDFTKEYLRFYVVISTNTTAFYSVQRKAISFSRTRHKRSSDVLHHPLSLNDHRDSRLGNCPSIRGCFFIPVVRAAFSDDY